MPLAFQSLNHGTIAFGFFNIETDLLLLDHYFLFADDFCEYISQLTVNTLQGDHECTWDICYIEANEDIGDLMGAMHGIRYQGFIGEVYTVFAFPEREEDFKQKYDGFLTRTKVEPIIRNYSEMRTISFKWDMKADRIRIGDYLFTREVFHELIHYVWRGGYPRWKDEKRPDYVTAMKEKIEQCKNRLFAGFALTATS